MIFSNKKAGTSFEEDLALILSENDFWVHCIQDNQNGQPFDIIATKNGMPAAIDCKDCVNGVFVLSRMEENQCNAMSLWGDCGNGHAVFAVQYPDNDIWIFPYDVLEKERRKGIKRIKSIMAPLFGRPLENFMGDFE